MAGITPLVMPKWGLEMREGVVNAWLVEEGETIKSGQPVLEVETDKISGVVEAADPGILRRKTAEVGQRLPVKGLLGVLVDGEASDAEIDAFIAGYHVPAEADEGEGEAAASPYRRVEVDGITVRHTDPGSGERVVLFLHGFGGDLDNWLFNLQPLSERYRAIALDLPGHGQSTISLPGTTVAELARFVVRFLDTIGVGSVHVVGHSLGGAIASQLALAAPARVESLTLVSPAGLGDEIGMGYIDGFISSESRRDLKPVAEMLFAKPELVTRQMLDDLLRYKRLDGVGELLRRLADGLWSGGRQAEQPGRRLGETGKRVRIIWGEQDRVVPAAHARNAPKEAKVTVFPDAGHMAMMERAAEVNALIREQVGS